MVLTFWWWAIWGKWDQNNDEVADDVDADDRNICKAISFLGFGTSPKRFQAEGEGGGPWWFKQGPLGPSMRSRSQNLSLKQGTEGGHIFQKRKKLFTYICKWRRPFRFANKTKWTSVKMSRTISSIVHSSIQLFYRFKILLDKKKIVGYLEVFQQIVGFNILLTGTRQFFSSYHCTNIYWVGRRAALCC